MRRDEGSVHFKQLKKKQSWEMCQAGQIGPMQPSRTVDHQDISTACIQCFSVQHLLKTIHFVAVQNCLVSHCVIVRHHTAFSKWAVPTAAEWMVPCMPLIPPCPLAKWPIYLSSFPQPIFFLLWVSLTRNLGSSKVTVENLGWLSFCCSSFSAAFLYVSEEIFVFF